MAAGPNISPSDARRSGLLPVRAVLALDRAVTALCRFVVVATGIALTVVMTVNIVARYVTARGNIAAFEELPERLFPWFIVAGIVLAAQSGGHMSVDTLLDRLGARGRVWLIHLVHLIVVSAYLLLASEALKLAEIAAVEKSPVLGLPGSHGYWAVAAGCILVSICCLTSSVRIWAQGFEARYAFQYTEV